MSIKELKSVDINVITDTGEDYTITFTNFGKPCFSLIETSTVYTDRREVINLNIECGHYDMILKEGDNNSKLSYAL